MMVYILPAIAFVTLLVGLLLLGSCHQAASPAKGQSAEAQKDPSNDTITATTATTTTTGIMFGSYDVSGIAAAGGVSYGTYVARFIVFSVSDSYP